MSAERRIDEGGSLDSEATAQTPGFAGRGPIRRGMTLSFRVLAMHEPVEHTDRIHAWHPSQAPLRRRAEPDRERATRLAETGPTITATLVDGPLEGRSIEAEVVEGRPPKTIDVPADDGSRFRYCLADWAQTGPSAVYTFLYRV